ncbi:PAS domain-containing protein [Marinifilum sp. N1E240]|uniref:sensor histidine kinase n=1 Tax=Marinifilum sp. N1E240 TaxID=2608082 RepID=UPI00128BA511|nr:ATP-binding protein [Marinifilum sp. N1E240]MPQ45565.1 PAS domain-containing protein [Marinifilum sp. N1E240]
MTYKHYNLALTFRLAILVGSSVWIGISIIDKAYYSLAFASIFLLISVWVLIRFLNKTHKQMDFFIKAIKNEDTTLRFPKKSGNLIINELHQSLNELNFILQEVQVKSKIKEKYFGEILQNISTGVVVLSEQTHVTDVNAAALELFGLKTFTHISQLNRIDSKFAGDLAGIQNKQKVVLDLNTSKEQIQINTACSEINLENEKVKLITLQDIRGELERKEIDAWVKLIRVLSHEIMNSLAPVTSIAQSLKKIWEEQIESEDSNLPEIKVAKTVSGLGVITEMSEALIRFVQSYRVLSKAPKPVLSKIPTQSFIDRLSILLSPIKEDFEGSLRVNLPAKNFEFIADEQMMIQVIINLVNNSREAFNGEAESSKIDINLIKKGQFTEIRVSDNGPGIPEEISDEIFIPFFTTKQKGSGIGLSYSRQIIRAHGGSLFCKSKEGETVFTIRW